MNRTVNSNQQITLTQNVVPRLQFTTGKYYLDFYSIQELCRKKKIARTTLFRYLKGLPNLDQHVIKYRNRSYFDETFILVHLKNLIFS